MTDSDDDESSLRQIEEGVGEVPEWMSGGWGGQLRAGCKSEGKKGKSLEVL